MLYTPHALVGIVIAKVIPNPFISIVISFVSHMLFDVYPHTNPDPKTASGWIKQFMYFDILFGVAISISLSYILADGYNFNFWVYLACTFSANLPDLMMIPYVLFNKSQNKIVKFSAFVCRIQKNYQNHVEAIYGYPSQLLIMLWCLLYFFYS